MNSDVITVSALNRLARETLEQRFPLMWVSGEVSNLTRAASGHFYFSLKDETAQARCVMFRGRAQLLPFQLQNGMQVEARVLVSLYEPRGDFKLNVEGLRRAGLGALYEAFTRVKDKLAREGVFDAANKRALPERPRVIGVVTSLAAAALRDVLVALQRRARHVPVILYPVPVQGEGAGAKIAERLREAGARAECDVLILTRGGGSIEDLWAFNEEVVARAIRDCPIPLVVGVGHETDVTIADLAADLRAPTPTAAAELASAGHLAFVQTLSHHQAALARAMRRQLETLNQRLDLVANRLHHPRHRIELAGVRLAALRARFEHSARREFDKHQHAVERLNNRLQSARPNVPRKQELLQQLQSRLMAAMSRTHAADRLRVDTLATHLAHLDPSAILSRGYSIIRDRSGHIVRRADSLNAGDRIGIQLAEGNVTARVE